MLRLGYISDPASGADIDEVFAVFMKAPRTYTREDIAEIHSHGGFAAQSSIMKVILEPGGPPCATPVNSQKGLF